LPRLWRARSGNGRLSLLAPVRLVSRAWKGVRWSLPGALGAWGAKRGAKRGGKGHCRGCRRCPLVAPGVGSMQLLCQCGARAWRKYDCGTWGDVGQCPRAGECPRATSLHPPKTPQCSMQLLCQCDAHSVLLVKPYEQACFLSYSSCGAHVSSLLSFRPPPLSLPPARGIFK
jgi:hypothetical protein